MFFRLLLESFVRQRRRKLLAGTAILLGITAVTAMLALATTIGDRIHQELAVYGANIVVYPQADSLDVKVGGVDLKPATGGAYLHESDLPKLKTIFWGNNITGVSPELRVKSGDRALVKNHAAVPVDIIGLWFDHDLSGLKTGAPDLHPWWKLEGRWPVAEPRGDYVPVVLGTKIAQRLGLHTGDAFALESPEARTAGVIPNDTVQVDGILSTGDAMENEILPPLSVSQGMNQTPDAVSRVEVSARTKPEDAFARSDPDSLSPQQKEIWYCRPYAASIAYQIRGAIPGAQAEQIRRVEQSEGKVLARISGLMWLVSLAALLAASFAVSAAMATAVLERRVEIGLMRSLGASRGGIALLFYAETGLLALMAGGIGYLLGSVLAAVLGAKIFAGDGSGAAHIAVLNPVLLPVVLALALFVAIAGSTSAICSALRMDPAAVLRGDA